MNQASKLKAEAKLIEAVKVFDQKKSLPQLASMPKANQQEEVSEDVETTGALIAKQKRKAFKKHGTAAFSSSSGVDLMGTLSLSNEDMEKIAASIQAEAAASLTAIK